MYRCKYLAHGLYISYDCFRHCHLSIHAPEERENNFIVNYKGPNDKVDWDLVFAKKKELVEGMRKGEIPNFCKGCHWLEEFDENSPEQYLSDLDSYIDMIWLGHFNECNARCLYCHAFELLSRKSITKDYGVITLLQEMFEKKIYNLEKNPDANISFAHGEPTLLQKFNDIMELCEKYGNRNIALYTNGILCSDTVEKMLKNRKSDVNIVISLDSGSREVYKKVKFVDKFDDVCETIRRYVIAAGDRAKFSIGIKYIIIPKINDTKEEIDKFYDICVNKLGVKYLIADLEEKWFVRHNGEVPEYYKDLLRYFKKKCEDNNIRFIFFDRALVTEL